MSERLDRTLADPAGFRHWTPVGIRFRDLDLLGHVNNVNLAGWLEDGRVALELPVQPLTASYAGPVIVLAELRIEYREEIRFGMEVRVGTRVQRIGRSSVTLGQTVMADDRCAAIAEAVEVLIDAETRRPISLPPEFRSLFERHAGGAEARAP
ncbi:MAG: thioesterase family protein [Gemmatimonadales bacterium]